ncbi:hypothetical protein DVG80_18725, partial [Rhodococcus erythropolis]
MTRNLQYNELIEVVSAWWDSRVVQDTQGSLTTAEALGDLAKWCNNLGYETPLELHSKQIISQNHAGKTTDLRSRT